MTWREKSFTKVTDLRAALPNVVDDDHLGRNVGARRGLPYHRPGAGSAPSPRIARAEDDDARSHRRQSSRGNR
jgi:hypothetical protein